MGGLKNTLSGIRLSVELSTCHKVVRRFQSDCVTTNSILISLFAGLEENPPSGELKHDLVKLALPFKHAHLCCLSY